MEQTKKKHKKVKEQNPLSVLSVSVYSRDPFCVCIDVCPSAVLV